MVHPFPPESLFFEHVQADSEVHLDSYWMGPRGSIPEVKGRGVKLINDFNLVPRIKQL
jgi:hypothetical protein